MNKKIHTLFTIPSFLQRIDPKESRLDASSTLMRMKKATLMKMSLTVEFELNLESDRGYIH